MAQASTPSPLPFSRETAERETAEEAAARTLSQDEHNAIVADRVARETAQLTGEKARLETENTELKTKLADSEKARETAEAAKATAEQALTEKTQADERQKAAAERFDERAKAVREAAYHLSDDFFTKERLERAAQMEDERFAEYVKELAEMAAASGKDKPDPTKETKDGAPRETAMSGSTVTEKAKTGNLRQLYNGGRERKVSA